MSRNLLHVRVDVCNYAREYKKLDDGISVEKASKIFRKFKIFNTNSLVLFLKISFSSQIRI